MKEFQGLLLQYFCTFEVFPFPQMYENQIIHRNTVSGSQSFPFVLAKLQEYYIYSFFCIDFSLFLFKYSYTFLNFQKWFLVCQKQCIFFLSPSLAPPQHSLPRTNTNIFFLFWFIHFHSSNWCLFSRKIVFSLSSPK